MRKFKKGKHCKISKQLVHIDKEVIIGENVIIQDSVIIQGKTIIEDNVVICHGTEIKDSVIKNGSIIKNSVIEGVEIGPNNKIGPFARLRPGTKTEKDVLIGNFVEIKNSFIGSNCNIIAPVSIGNGAYICAGTTITKDVKEDDFVIGRVRQEHKEGLAQKFLSKD